MLDGIGLAFAGSVAESGRIAREHFKTLGCVATSTVIGTPLRTAPRFAAFLNGTAMHADDYDDTQLAARPDRVYGLLTHPTAPVLPAVLAVAEERAASGADVLDAYVIGTEVEMKVAEAIDPRHYRDGFHSTGTIGAIGAAAAVARLRGADVATTLRALGIAASQSPGARPRAASSPSTSRCAGGPRRRTSSRRRADSSARPEAGTRPHRSTARS